MSKGFPFDHFFKKPGENQRPNHSFDLINQINGEKEESIQPKSSSTSLPSDGWSNDELLFLNQEVLKILKSLLTPEKFNALFKENLKLIGLRENNVEFSVPSDFIKSMIEGQFIEQIKDGIKGVLGKPYEIIIKTIPQTTNNSISSEAQSKQGNEARFTLDLNLHQTAEDKIQSAESQYLGHIENSPIRGQIIDPTKTFETFIIGPSNNLAFATSHAVASAPGKSGKYPCLYIYSDSGLGKTHLLHAVANGIKEKIPEKAICLISAREFMKELINAFKDKKLSEFQRKYSETIDVLMIDDIHELKNKQSTQEEFFHIFNELHSKGKQLIFTSDKGPQQINGIEERIITRLQWGLVIDIQRPDLETRIAILKRKSQELDLFVPDDVLTLIASSVKTSIRELEGSLIKLSATADVMDVEIDTEMARDFLNLAPGENAHSSTLESIAKATSQYFKIPLADLQSKSRNKDIVRARHIAWYLSKKIIDATLKEIAKFYGGRDHSSVIHGVNKITEQIKTDPSLSKDLIYLENNL